MSERESAFDPPNPEPPNAGEKAADRFPCPNCCRLAHVTGRRMGLIFYRCDLCDTVGAAPEPGPAGDIL